MTKFNLSVGGRQSKALATKPRRQRRRSDGEEMIGNAWRRLVISSHDDDEEEGGLRRQEKCHRQARYINKSSSRAQLNWTLLLFMVARRYYYPCRMWPRHGDEGGFGTVSHLSGRSLLVDVVVVGSPDPIRSHDPQQQRFDDKVRPTDSTQAPQWMPLALVLWIRKLESIAEIHEIHIAR